MSKNPFVLFLPFLLLYIFLILVSPSTGAVGDESRYLIYTKYMLNGFNPISDPAALGFDYLGNGPGYSLLLLPFVALKFPLIFITVLNAFFYYFSIVLLFKSISQFASFTIAMTACLFWACYYNLYEYLIMVYPESLCAFLICLLIYCITLAFKKKYKAKYLYLAGAAIGYLALTKPIFGYLLLCMLVGSTALWLIYRHVPNYRKSVIILFTSLVITIPYLVYTHHVTGKMLYWSSFGGNNLYWMSSPSDNEYGDWFRDPSNTPNPTSYRIPGSEESIAVNHKKDFEVINRYEGVERDEAYKKIALQNITAHPVKFIQNCIYNLSRILFNYPYSYTLQKPATLIRLPLNGTIFILVLISIIPALRNWRKIPFAIQFMIFFSLIYLGGSILGSAETRMFILLAPLSLVVIAFMIPKFIKINMKEWAD